MLAAFPPWGCGLFFARLPPLVAGRELLPSAPMLEDDDLYARAYRALMCCSPADKVAAVAQVQYLSVLLDDRHMPALLVTADTQGSVLQLQRLNEVREGREDSMQLWALDGDKPPRSLGVIASTYKTLQLPAPATALAGVQELAISVEDKGGAAEGRGPRLPYLFKGGLVKKAL